VLAAMAANPLVPFVAGVVIGVPSALLYLLQALVIVFRRKTAEFRSSFYRLVVLRASIVSSLFKREFHKIINDTSLSSTGCSPISTPGWVWWGWPWTHSPRCLA
jgi:hypothetical protein